MYLFQLAFQVSTINSFYGLPLYTKFCLNDNETRKYLLPSKVSNCSDICFIKDIKLDLFNNICILPCIQTENKYEYNKICYKKCPKRTLVNNKICEDIDCDEKNNNLTECLNNLSINYYYDYNIDLYIKCFDTCKACNGEGNKTYHNCLECKSNLDFLNLSEYATNCYEKCEYYHYIDLSYNFHCTEKYECPGRYNKLIPEKKKCIDKCKNDDTYKYEYENKCLLFCPKDTFYKENDKICHKLTFIETTQMITEMGKESNKITKSDLLNTINIIPITEELPIYNEERDKNIGIFRKYRNNK